MRLYLTGAKHTLLYRQADDWSNLGQVRDIIQF
jgi:hypothetical protein